MTTALVWFRRDLRVHDHPPLRAALDAHDRVVPVFVLEDRLLAASENRANFLYACLHFMVYFAVDQFFDFGEIWKDILKRKFITVGVAAFVMLIPLAVTSTNGMVKRLGFPRWKRLHRLVYLSAACGVICGLRLAAPPGPVTGIFQLPLLI